MLRASKYLLDRNMSLRMSPKRNRYTEHSWKLSLLNDDKQDIAIARYSLIGTDPPKLYISQIETVKEYRRQGHASFLQYLMAKHSLKCGASIKEIGDYTSLGYDCFDKLPNNINDRVEVLENKLK